MKSIWSPYFALQLQRDVDHRAADARLAQLRRREQQRDRLLADDVGEVCSCMSLVGRRVSIDSTSPPADATVSVCAFGACSPTAGILSSPGAITWICPGAATGLPSTSVTAITA